MTLPLRPSFGNSAPARKIRVLVVDDSALARRAIVDALSHDAAIEVVGVASDPYVARDRILELEPDVITLDLEMPRMDGLTFLRILQEHHPLPVVVVSSLAQAGSQAAFDAMEAGAVDVLAKPDGTMSIGSLGAKLAYHVKAAAASSRFQQPRPLGRSADSLPMDAQPAPAGSREEPPRGQRAAASAVGRGGNERSPGPATGKACGAAGGRGPGSSRTPTIGG